MNDTALPEVQVVLSDCCADQQMDIVVPPRPAKRKNSKVTVMHSAEMRCLYQMSGYGLNRIVELYSKFGYKRSTIHEHAVKPIAAEHLIDKRSLNKGRPRLLSERDDSAIVVSLKKLRDTEGTFTSPRIQVESGTTEVSNRTVRRSLNRQHYHYNNTQRKGRLSPKDLKLRTRFCRDIKKQKLGQEFWKRGIAFYVDGVGFEYKSNPLDQARSPTAREWMRDDEKLKLNCTAKGKKEGAVNVNFMVGIAHGAGVVLCEQYYGPITGEKMAGIVRKAFENAFSKVALPNLAVRRILQDNCRRQNSAAALLAMWEHDTLVFNIPARSPDLNPIENFFHLEKDQLKKDAKKMAIKQETFEMFSERCANAMRSFPSEKIDSIIESMPKRINEVIKANGNRLKY